MKQLAQRLVLVFFSRKTLQTMILDTVQDIFTCTAPSVIIHQVNCLGYGSMGIMARVIKLWPSLFSEYHQLCGWFKDYHKQNDLLGSMQALPIPKTKMILCNAFSQKFYSDTKYESLPDMWNKILRKAIAQTKANFKKTGILYEFHCPNKIGVGMKPNEIDALKDVVTEHFTDSAIKWVYHI